MGKCTGKCMGTCMGKCMGKCLTTLYGNVYGKVYGNVYGNVYALVSKIEKFTRRYVPEPEFSGSEANRISDYGMLWHRQRSKAQLFSVSRTLHKTHYGLLRNLEIIWVWH